MKIILMKIMKIIKNILHIHETKEQGIHYSRNELHIFCKTCSSMASTSSITTIRDVQCNQQKMQWSKLRVQSFHHGKREDLTSFGTLKIDIFKVLGCGDFKRNIYIAD